MNPHRRRAVRDADALCSYRAELRSAVTSEDRCRQCSRHCGGSGDVTLTAVPDGLPHTAEIVGDVRSPARVRMSYRFTIDRDEAGSVVTDTLRLRTPPGLLRFAAFQAGAVRRTRARVLTDRPARPA